MSKEAERISDLVAAKLKTMGSDSDEPLADDFRIARYTISSTEFKNKFSLPKETASWVIYNESDNEIRWSDRNNPITGQGEGGYAVIRPKSSIHPPIVPAFLKRPIDVWMANTDSGVSNSIVLIYVTSRNPVAAALVAGISSFGTMGSDIEIGAVELKDGSSDIRVTVISGSDGINYINVRGSGGTVISKISGDTVISKISGETIIAKTSGESLYVQANDAVLGTGQVNWGSGNAANTEKILSFSSPTPRNKEALYSIDVYNTALSSDMTVIFNHFITFGDGINRRPEITRVSVLRGTSGVSSIVRGFYVGNTTGEIVLKNDQAMIENATCNVVVSRL